MVAVDIGHLVGNTPMVGLPTMSPDGYRLYLKLEGTNPTGSIKDRVAQAMVRDAERSGRLQPGSRMIEPTSGNTGIALAALCPTRQYKLTCVMPRNTSAERRELLEAYGVDIVWSPAEEGSNGSILLAQELVARDSDLVMLFQYGNPANPRVHYETTAPEILRDVPDVGAVVSGLGTGGTLTGTGRRLKEVNPEAKVFAAEPEYGELVYGLRSLEDGFVPPILDTTILDGRIKVQGDRAVAATQQLLTTTGIFAGVSTGAAIDVAIRMCSPRRLPKGTSVVIVSADGGWKYVSTGAYGADSPDLANSLWA